MGWVAPLGTVVFVQRAKNIALSFVDLGPVYMEVHMLPHLSGVPQGQPTYHVNVIK